MPVYRTMFSRATYKTWLKLVAGSVLATIVFQLKLAGNISKQLKDVFMFEDKIRQNIVIVLKTPIENMNMTKETFPTRSNTDWHGIDITDNTNNASQNYANTHKPSKKISFWVIFSYFRSGSSLTGEVLQYDPRTFYVYEPMHGLDFLLKNKTTHVFNVDGTVTNVSWAKFEERALDITEAYFNCDLTKLDIRTITHGFNYFSHKHSHYMYCVDPKKITKTDLLGRIRKCLPMLQNACHNTIFRYLKIMRVPMEYFEGLMEKYENMKILHLIRDPRAVFYSWSTLGPDMFSDVENSALPICSYNVREIQTFKRFQKLFPGRLKRLYYEDIARNPVKTIKSLYDYLNLNFTTDVEYHIRSITSMGIEDDCSNCITRSNSTAHIYNWRKFINASNIAIIDKVCKKMYRETGYVPG